MQKRIYLILAVALMTLVAYLFLFPKKEVLPPVTDSITEPKEAIETVTPQLNTMKEEDTPEEVHTTTKPPPSQDEPSNIVSLEVKEGYAVAFGDIILGVPEDESLKKGSYEMPVPDYWDKPEIPYAIDANVPDPNRILTALKHIESKAGMKFIPYESQKDALLFQKGKEHCLSALGRRGGLQPIRISEKCSWHEITHEVLHSLGFIHEQSRPDRNKFVEVQWENIDDKFLSQFEMLPYEFMGPSKDTDFDYESVMLYETNFFVKEENLANMKSLTSIPINPSQSGLSLGDIKRLKKLYRLD